MTLTWKLVGDWILAGALFCAGSANFDASAQPPKPAKADLAAEGTNRRRAGDLVVVVVPAAPLKVGSAIVGTAHWGELYQIAREDGDWIWLRPATPVLEFRCPGWAMSSVVEPIDKAEALFVRAINEASNADAAYAARAAYWGLRCDATKSLADADAAIQLAPNRAPHYVNRALIHAWQGHFDDALSDCNAALRIDPKLASASFARGVVYHRLHANRYALAEFETAIRHGCLSPALFEQCAHASFEGSRSDKSIDLLSRAIACDPTNASYFAGRANYRFNQRDHDRGLEDMTTAVQLEPGNASYRLCLAKSLRFFCKASVTAEAAAAMSAAGLQDDVYKEALFFFARSPPPGAAIQVLERLDTIIAESPSERAVQALGYRASTRAMVGDYPGAISDFEKVSSLSPKSTARCREWLISLHGLTGDDVKARACLTEANAEQPIYPRIHWLRDFFEPVVPLKAVQADEVLRTEDVIAEFDLPRSGHIILPVRVGGGAFRFILDTGSSHTVLDTNLRSLLGEPVEQLTAKTLSGEIQAVGYEPARLTFAGVEVSTNTPMLCSDLSRFKTEDDSISGCLGTDVLRHFILYLNCDQGKVAVLRRVPQGAGERIPIMRGPGTVTETGDFRPDNDPKLTFLPRVLLRLPNGRKTLFILDSGAIQTAIALDTRLFDELSGEQQLQTIATRPVETPFGDLGDRRVGLLTGVSLFSTGAARVTVDESNGNAIRLPYLFRYIVIIDFPNDLMYVRPSQLFNACDAQIDARNGKPILRVLRGPLRRQPAEK